MNKHEAKSRILKCGLLPVVRADDAEQAIGICEALVEGNVDIVEVTMTVPGALKVMERIADSFGDRIVMGAGTVLDEQTARSAILAGAEFIVSPGTSRAVVETARRYSKIVCPGALTPTEVLAAWEMGADFVKVFPCGEVGGAKYIKSLKAPYPQIEFVPTGGVNLDTAADFLRAGCSALGVGAALVDKKAAMEGKYEIIVENAKKFLAIIDEVRAGEN